MRRRLAALLAVVATATSACTGGSGGRHNGPGSPSAPPGITAPGAGANDPANIPDAGALAKAAAGLPSDPIATVDALVAKVFGQDAKAAVAAAGVLLLRAGIPLVSASGPVVALPSPIVIVNAPTDVEILPALVDQVRQHVRYTPTQILAIAKYVGLSEQHLTPAQLVGTFQSWGKVGAPPAASVYAAAAVRALAARHGQVLTPEGVPDAKTAAALAKGPGALPDETYLPLAAPGGVVDFDPLQVLLFFAHAMSDASEKVTVAHHRPPYPSPAPASPGHSSLVGLSADPCDALVDLEQTEVGRIDQKFAKTVLQDQLTDAIEDRWGKAAGEAAGKAFKGIEKFEDVAAYFLFVAGLGFDLTADKARTHFRHESADSTHDVEFSAHAYFAIKIPQKYLACWTLAGLQIPKNTKGLKGFKVDWSEPNGTVALKPNSEDSEELLNPVVLGDDGVSTLSTYPRREADPPRPGQAVPVNTVYQQVRASLDKNYLGVHLSDLLPLLAGPEALPATLISVAYNNIVGLIKEAGLPSKQIELPVDYHGANAFGAKGDGSLNLLFYATIVLHMDLYSCSGAGGPWKGTVSLRGDTGVLTEMMGRMVGHPGHGSATFAGPMTFRLDPKSTASQKRYLSGSNNGVVLELDGGYVKNGFTPESAQDQASVLYGRLEVGEASWLFNDTDLRYFADVLGPLFATNVSVPLDRLSTDPRCPGGSLQDDSF